MESGYGNGGSRLVVTELSHIKDLVMQLETHLDGSHDRCKQLTSQIFSLTERSIGMITTSPGLICGRKRASATPSPLSDVADVPFKSTKKRKMMRKHQVRMKAAEGGKDKEPVEDGHCWRKYGQKPILGAMYPRSYYRCRHRHSQGCRAMKKVQRADEDPTLFDVVYYDTHTCVERTAAAAAGQLAAHVPEHHPDAHSLLHSLSGGLTVKTERLAAATEPQDWDATTAPFCPSSTSPVSWCLSPATSDIADEFLDIDIISSFFD